MGHFSDDKNFDEFMNASSDDWSKPETPPASPEPPVEPTDRWGSPIPDKGTAPESNRWGSEPANESQSSFGADKPKSGSKWWIILIVVVVLLCLCACLVLFGLPLLGINWFGQNFNPADFLQF